MQDNFNIHSWKLKQAINELENRQCPDCGCKMEGQMCNECGYMEEGATFTDKHDDNPKLKGGQKDLPDEVQAKIVKKEVSLNEDEDYDAIAQEEFGLDYDQLGPNEQEWVRDEAYNRMNEGEDHEVSMAQNSLKAIISSASQLMAKLGDNERNIPGWIQDHIAKSENYIEQANQSFHELDNNNEED